MRRQQGSALDNIFIASRRWRRRRRQKLPLFATFALSFFFFVEVIDAARNPRFGLRFAPQTRLTWVNGIGYNTTHMEKEAPLIAKYFGGKKVEFYHNPTKMVDEQDTRGYFSDLTQAGKQKYLGRITSEVNGLVEHLREAVRSVKGKSGKGGGIVVHIAHSQGALVTCLAATQLTPLEMNQIEVISFGGATPVRSTPETPFRRCVNYYSVNDPLLFLNPSAENALRSGFNHQHQHNYQYNNEGEDEFCFLAPRVGDPIADHMLLGPTYASALEWEGKRFERRYQSYLRRIVRFTVLSSVAILQTILQILALVWQKFATFMLELRIRRRSLLRSTIIKILAIRTWLITIAMSLLARTVAGIRRLYHPTTTATKATSIITKGSASGSLPEAPPSSPLSVASASASPTAKSAYLLRFIRRKETPVLVYSEDEITATTTKSSSGR